MSSVAIKVGNYELEYDRSDEKCHLSDISGKLVATLKKEDLLKALESLKKK